MFVPEAGLPRGKKPRPARIPAGLEVLQEEQSRVRRLLCASPFGIGGHSTVTAFHLPLVYDSFTVAQQKRHLLS